MSLLWLNPKAGFWDLFFSNRQAPGDDKNSAAVEFRSIACFVNVAKAHRTS